MACMARAFNPGPRLLSCCDSNAFWCAAFGCSLMFMPMFLLLSVLFLLFVSGWCLPFILLLLSFRAYDVFC